MIRNSLASLFLAFPALITAQQATAPESAQTTELPLAKIVLSPGKPVAGLERSHIIVRPLQCTSNGGVLMEIPMPPAYDEMRVASLTPSGGHFFDFNAIPSLYDRLLLSFFPSDSSVVFLFNATEENKESGYRLLTDKGQVVTGKGNRTEHHTYLVRFSLDGHYKSATRLPGSPSDVQFMKIAELSSGEMLLLSYDMVNRSPKLQLADHDGKPIKSIPLQGGITDDKAITKAVAGDSLDAAKAFGNVSGWQFIPARGRVLLYNPLAKTAPEVLEISEGGFVREVQISAPPGYQLDGFVPSAKRWFAIFRRSDLSGGPSGIDSSASGKNYLMAELNPSDGSVRRLFTMDGGSFFDIACEVGGQFISYETDLGSEFLLSSTDVPN